MIAEYINTQLAVAIAGTNLVGNCVVVPWNQQLPAGWAVQWDMPTTDIEGIDLARSAPNYTFQIALSAPEGYEKEFEYHYLNFADQTTLIYQLSKLPWQWTEFIPGFNDYSGGKRLEARSTAILQGYRLATV